MAKPQPTKLNSRDPQSGVTLVEVMVVLVLVGVMVGAVALGVSRLGQSENAMQSAQLLVARLNRAADETVLSGQAMRFSWTESTYEFARKNLDGPDDWDPHPLPLLATPRTLGGGLQFTSDHTFQDYVVSGNMIPDPPEILRLAIRSDRGPAVEIAFDGVNASVVEATQ